MSKIIAVGVARRIFEVTENCIVILHKNMVINKV